MSAIVADADADAPTYLSVQSHSTTAPVRSAARYVFASQNSLSLSLFLFLSLHEVCLLSCLFTFDLDSLQTACLLLIADVTWNMSFLIVESHKWQWRANDVSVDTWSAFFYMTQCFVLNSVFICTANVKVPIQFDTFTFVEKWWAQRTHGAHHQHHQLITKCTACARKVATKGSVEVDREGKNSLPLSGHFLSHCWLADLLLLQSSSLPRAISGNITSSVSLVVSLLLLQQCRSWPWSWSLSWSVLKSTLNRQGSCWPSFCPKVHCHSNTAGFLSSGSTLWRHYT